MYCICRKMFTQRNARHPTDHVASTVLNIVHKACDQRPVGVFKASVSLIATEKHGKWITVASSGLDLQQPISQIETRSCDVVAGGVVVEADLSDLRRKLRMPERLQFGPGVSHNDLLADAPDQFEVRIVEESSETTQDLVTAPRVGNQITEFSQKVR